MLLKFDVVLPPTFIQQNFCSLHCLLVFLSQKINAGGQVLLENSQFAYIATKL